MRTFKDIKIAIESIEYDKENVTEDNPDGMICYGTDLEEEAWGDDYITVVTINNFICIVEDRDRLEI